MVMCTTPPFRAAVRLNSGVRPWRKILSTDSKRIDQDKRAAWLAAFLILALVAIYVVLSLIASYRPNWLPGDSILEVALFGPIALLPWGGGNSKLYWICTALLAGTATAGGAHEDLQVPAVILFLLIWLGAGFFAVGLSV